MADGLSQDEFVELCRIVTIPYEEMMENEMITLMQYLRRIIEAKEQQIVELNQELYDIATQKSKQNDTQSTETDTSEAPP